MSRVLVMDVESGGFSSGSRRFYGMAVIAVSVLSDLQRDIGFAAHQQVNGDYVVRTLKSGETESGIVAIWNEYAEDKLAALRPQRELRDGEEVSRHGLLLVPVTQTVAVSDTWNILDEDWVVQRMGSRQNGYREIYLQRNDKTRTRRPEKTRLV